jgi:hypothetical protein
LALTVVAKLFELEPASAAAARAGAKVLSGSFEYNASRLSRNNERRYNLQLALTLSEDGVANDRARIGRHQK